MGTPAARVGGLPHAQAACASEHRRPGSVAASAGGAAGSRSSSSKPTLVFDIMVSHKAASRPCLL